MTQCHHVVSHQAVALGDVVIFFLEQCLVKKVIFLTDYISQVIVAIIFFEMFKKSGLLDLIMQHLAVQFYYVFQNVFDLPRN